MLVDPLERSGRGIAMASASDAVKARARVVTSSNADERFARAVHERVLPRAPARAG